MYIYVCICMYLLLGDPGPPGLRGDRGQKGMIILLSYVLDLELHYHNKVNINLCR